MEKNNKCVGLGFSRILWAVLAVLLCAVPCGARTVASGDTLNVGTGYPDVQILNDWLDVEGTLNMYPGAYVDWGIYAYPGAEADALGGTVNVYGCAPGNTLWVVEPGTSWPGLLPVVTVYGPKFRVGTTEYSPPADMPISDTLNVLSESGEVLFSLLVMSDIPIHLRALGTGPIFVEIDIKPGSDPNPINPGSNGLIPVAILTTADFDAACVDPATVTLAGEKVAVRGKAEKLMARLEDVDGDGDLDLLVQVETQSDGTLWESGTVTLTGKTYDGQDIKGTDEVIIVPPE